MSDEIKLFLNRKNLATVFVLMVMVIMLPLGITLIRQQQIFFSKASGERIQLGTGKCIQDRNGTKVLICPEVPLNLTAPFDPSATASASPSATATQSASPSATATTSAIFNKSFWQSLVPEAKAQEVPGVCGDAGDVPGQGGFWDVQVNRCGEVLNYTQINNSCTDSVQVRFRTPKWDASKKEWYTEKQDGKILSQADIIEAAQGDYRIPDMTWIDSESDSPHINCSLFFRFSGRTDCATVLPKDSQGRSIGREGTELTPGGEITFTVSRDKPTANNDQPGCRQIIETDLNGGTGTQTPSPSPSQCTAGTFASAQMETSNGCGTVTTSMAPGATSGTLTYTAPNVSSDLNCNLKALTQNNGDCSLSNNGKGTASNPLKPNESMTVQFNNSCSDNAPGCTLPIVISQAGAIPTDRAAYKLAESEASLSNAPERGFLNQSFSTTYLLTDQKPGMKQIWVEFTDKQTGTKTKDFLNVELVEQAPLIKQVGCQLNIQKNSVDFTLSGLRFGAEKATITANGQTLDASSWQDTAIKAELKNANPNSGEQVYKVKVSREGVGSSEEVECKLGFTQLSLGAKLFCRGEGKFDLADVKLTIIDQSGNKVEETTSISKEGIISGLKTKFEIGKRYVISIDAPRVLRRNIEFTAKEGTTVITKDDGSTLFLPIGDIFPIATSGDGTINSLDQSELKRQWRTDATASGTLTADFNLDSRVNAFDWSCMRRDFGNSDDPLGSVPSSQSTGVNFNSGNGGSGGVISVEFGLPTPNPNVNPISDPVAQPDYPTEPQRVIQGR